MKTVEQKAAHAQYMREYWKRPEQKEKLKLRAAAYREKNKAILAQRQADRYYANHEENIQKKREYRAENLEKVKTYHREYCRTWREKNRDSLRIYSAKYQREHRDQAIDHKGRRRAREYGSKISRISWKQVWKSFTGYCQICQQPIRLGVQKFHYDHIIPISQGGEHSTVNLQITHSRCNLVKNKSLSVHLNGL